MRVTTSILLFIFSLFFGCKEEATTISSDPSDLSFTISNPADGSGEISISATSKNTTEYAFYAGDSENLTESNTTGQFDYKYERTGSFEVEIRAYGESGRFIADKKVITVISGDNEAGHGEDGYFTPLTYSGMKTIWLDEFTGSSLNTSYWNYEIGRGNNGWGNAELQYYRSENTSLSGGFLTIEAREESFDGASYTSSRLTTQNKFNFKFGRVDIRAKLPKGQGIWPALWMLGDNINSVGWPACGEIDIMEMVGGGTGRDDTTHGTIHWQSGGNHRYVGSGYTISEGVLNDKFHVFSIVWTEEVIEWFVDDIKFYSVDITPSDLSEFQNEFFFIFNIAVGGRWPGSPNASTVFPQKMTVDYVRVFQSE